jgi:hypothetical protein
MISSRDEYACSYTANQPSSPPWLVPGRDLSFCPEPVFLRSPLGKRCFAFQGRARSSPRLAFGGSIPTMADQLTIERERSAAVDIQSAVNISEEVDDGIYVCVLGRQSEKVVECASALSAVGCNHFLRLRM